MERFPSRELQAVVPLFFVQALSLPRMYMGKYETGTLSLPTRTRAPPVMTSKATLIEM